MLISYVLPEDERRRRVAAARAAADAERAERLAQRQRDVAIVNLAQDDYERSRRQAELDAFEERLENQQREAARDSARVYREGYERAKRMLAMGIRPKPLIDMSASKPPTAAPVARTATTRYFRNDLDCRQIDLVLRNNGLSVGERDEVLSKLQTVDDWVELPRGIGQAAVGQSGQIAIRRRSGGRQIRTVEKRTMNGGVNIR